jgi:hypothetical protein
MTVHDGPEYAVKKPIKPHGNEKELLASLEGGGWKSVGGKEFGLLRAIRKRNTPQGSKAEGPGLKQGS